MFLELENGQIVGFCESSFSMNLDSKRVRVWSKDDAEAYLKQYQKVPKEKRIFKQDKKAYRWNRVFLVRLDSNNSIKIKQQNPSKTYMKEGKYATRNHPFTIV